MGNATLMGYGNSLAITQREWFSPMQCIYLLGCTAKRMRERKKEKRERKEKKMYHYSVHFESKTSDKSFKTFLHFL